MNTNNDNSEQGVTETGTRPGIVKTIAGIRLPVGFGRRHLLGVSLIIFLSVQAVTGFLLSLYYHPSPDIAHESIEYIIGKVSFGWFIRSVHYWSAELIVVFLFLHTIRVFVSHSYLKCRSSNWILGCLLVFTLFAFRFTGCFFAYDETSYWMTIAGGEVVRNIPIAGGFLMNIFYGGNQITGDTLCRFYTFHIVMLPWLTFFLLAFHLFLVGRQGFDNSPSSGRKKGCCQVDNSLPPPVRRGQKLFPIPFLKAIVLVLCITAGLLLLAGFFPAGLGNKAVSHHESVDVDPEWFFSGLKGFLSLFGENWPALGYVFVAFSWILVLALPFWVPKGPSMPARIFRLLAGAAILIALVYSSLLAYR
jgi:quinol-cytochrome oxidoreductase complex cytochrome b subunit